MTISTTCKNCKSQIKLKTNSSDKVVFAMENGEIVKLQCEKCGSQEKYHVDTFSTKPSKLSLIIASIIFLVGTPVTLFLVWDEIMNSGCILCITSLFIPIIIPSLIYGIMVKNDRIRVNYFNRHNVKGY